MKEGVYEVETRRLRFGLGSSLERLCSLEFFQNVLGSLVTVVASD